MSILESIILGIVEGVTEFLPISSTFHLIFVAKWLGIPDNDFLKLFQVFIQAGAIMSVLLLYIKELARDKVLMKFVLISFIPTATIGFLLYRKIKSIFFVSEVLMVGAFFIMGILFLLVEHYLKIDNVPLKKGLKGLTISDAIRIGLVQSLAVIPGVSRAGSVIIGMLFLGYNRSDAAKYSFMLSIPTIFAASFYDLYKMRDVLIGQQENIMLLIVGSVAAFISSYVVIKWFIDYLRNHTLKVFGWYRILLVIIILLVTYSMALFK